MKHSAFTLIELLIVIVIIGILSAALIPRIRGVRDRAKYTALGYAAREIQTAVYLTQTSTNQTLREITEHPHSYQSCLVPGEREVASYSNISAETSDCRTDRKNALTAIVDEGALGSGFIDAYETDPRGNPYLLDENEGQTTACVADELFSIGTAQDDQIIIDNDNSPSNNIHPDTRQYELQGLYCNAW